VARQKTVAILLVVGGIVIHIYLAITFPQVRLLIVAGAVLEALGATLLERQRRR
jgi:hypothetical protein